LIGKEPLTKRACVGGGGERDIAGGEAVDQKFPNREFWRFGMIVNKGKRQTGPRDEKKKPAAQNLQKEKKGTSVKGTKGQGKQNY